VYATDPTPSVVTLVEPRTTLENWPAVVTVDKPFVVATTFTNTTSKVYGFTSPYLYLYSPEAGAIDIEVRNGTGWRSLSMPANNQLWQYDSGITLAPGATYRNSLRITYHQDVDGNGHSVVQHLIAAAFGNTITAAEQVFTVAPRT
jgi:hypothetical protein